MGGFHAVRLTTIKVLTMKSRGYYLQKALCNIYQSKNIFKTTKSARSAQMVENTLLTI